MQSERISPGVIRLGVAAVLAIGLMLAVMGPAMAHDDPDGCSASTVALSFRVFNDEEGMSPIAGTDTVQSGQTVYFRTRLFSGGLEEDCSFGGGPDGQVTITTPDGVEHLVVDPGGVPHVTEDDPFITPMQPYVVSEADLPLDASTSYDGGISHTGGSEPFENEGHDEATADATRSLNYEDVSLDVSKTADPAFDREFTWDIAKSVDIAEHTLEPGQSATSTYTVDVTQTGSDDTGHRVSGDITISNPAEFATSTIESVSDSMDGISATVDCGIEFPNELGAGETLECTYEAELDDDSTLTNLAEVETSGDVDGGSATSTVDFTGVDPTQVTNGTVNVEDSVEGDLGEFSDSGSVSYTRTFACNEDEGTHSNTATIVETGQSADASVEVICEDIALDVSKTADPAFDRTITWDIAKSVDIAEHTLEPGQSATSTYTVDVTQTGSEDSGHRVSGDITITNPAESAVATIEGVADSMDGISATVDCGVTFPHELGAGETLECTYEAELDDDSTLTNLAEVETSGDVDGGSATSTVDFTDVEPTDVVNEAVNVEDSFEGDLGEFSESGSVSYTRTFACNEDEGTHDNTATIVETDQSADASVEVICEDIALDVSKTADPAFDRTITWDIAKSVDIAEHTLEPGQSATSTYTVDVTQTGSDDTGHRVSGDITISNPAESAVATIESVSDSMDGISATVDCGVSFPHELGAGETLECTYEAELDDDGTLTNVAEVETSGDVDGGSATSTVDFTGVEPTEVTNGTVNVDDSVEGDLGPFSDSGSVSYTRTFACNEDEGTHDNTATIVETDQSADASVEVICEDIALDVSKTADPAFDREFTWDIAKSVDIAEHTLEPGQSATSTYTVDVTQTGSDDTGHRVSGVITISNPAQSAVATIEGVADSMDGISATVDCGVTFPHELGAGETLECTYEAELDDDSTLTNLAEVETSGDVNGGSATSTVDFTGVEPTEVTNGTVNVEDSVEGDLDSFSDSGSTTYTRTFACNEDEGTHGNTATIVETGQSADASVEVICVTPSIDIEKATNGEDADEPTGPNIPMGEPVNWTYEVTNTGEVALTSLTVTDDQGVAVDCPQDTLAVGESITCTASSTAEAGQYANVGTATGTSPAGNDVSDSDPSHYFGVDASIDIEKATNGEDADDPTGPYIPVGDPVNWTYEVTNTGNAPLTSLTVTDDQGVVVDCAQDTLAVGESITCTATSTAEAGQYANVGAATGTPPAGDDVSDSDPSHYFGVDASIDIEKATNGEDADEPTGPEIPVGDPVNWTYEVTNTGNAPLTSLTVTDDQGVAVDCAQDTLAAGESITCTATSTAEAGQYANVGTATGTPPAGDDVSDSDPSHYFGVGLEGCTPGYWRQSHHFFAWVDFSQEDDFETVFGVDASFDATLHEAVSQGGGGELALGRHAVAALLNSTNDDVTFAFTTDEVIAMVQDAYATGDFEGVKDTLEEENEQGCDLGNGKDRGDEEEEDDDDDEEDDDDDEEDDEGNPGRGRGRGRS